MIIDFIGRNIRIVCLALFIGLAATAASMYWNVPARWKSTGQKPTATDTKPAVTPGAACPMDPAPNSAASGENHTCGMTLGQSNATAAAEHSGCESAGGGCCGAPK